MPIKSFPVFGDIVEVLMSRESTGGCFSMIAQNTQPGGGPPPHVHYNEDEILMAVDGEFEIFLNGVWSKMVCGEPKFLARGEEHAFRNSGTTPGRIMGIATPGGLDEYLEMISPISMPRDAAKLLAISEEYGIKFTRMGDAPVAAEETALAMA